MDESREQQLQYLLAMLRKMPYTFEIVVKEKPKGMRIIYEVTKEYMDKMIERAEQL